MKQPISVYLDPDCPLAYIQYLDDSATFDGSLPLRRDPDGTVRDHTFAEMAYVESGVLIDVTPDDDIIAFEVLNINDAESVAIARDSAAENGLGFPAAIRAAAVAGDPAA